MNILFLTTFNVPIEKEHFFTIDVWNRLCKDLPNCSLGSIIFDVKISKSQIEEDSNNLKTYYKLHIPSHLKNDKYILIKEIENFIKYIKPDIIHSNMIEGYDVQAARNCKVPIVLTVHIGGILCPRGGGNGFLTYKDSICNQRISKKCFNCCSMDMPFPALARSITNIIPFKVLLKLYELLKRHKIYYISAILDYIHNINNRIELCNTTFKYATFIAANNKLIDLFHINGLNNAELIPHGIPKLEKVPINIVKNEAIKLFSLGRVQYSKGLHILFRALRGINHSNYELHIFGILQHSRSSKLYTHRLKNMAKRLNVIFHGQIPHDKISDAISNCHVMIHSTICLEVYGIAIAESLSIGRPVLATRCGGAEMQITDGVNGWLIDPNDTLALRNKILTLISHPELIEEAAANCKTPHPIDKYIKKIEQLYEGKICLQNNI